MSRHPYGPDELDRTDPRLDDVAHRLEAYAARHGDEPPIGLAARIRASLADEPRPSAGWVAGLRAWLRGGPRLLAVAAVVGAAVVGAILIGELAQNARNQDVGSSPGPSVPASQSIELSPSPSPTTTPTMTPIPAATPVTSPSISPRATVVPTIVPSPSDDHGGLETPKPSGSDNSGPGGGGGGDD
jgi:hypothetical protein